MRCSWRYAPAPSWQRCALQEVFMLVLAIDVGGDGSVGVRDVWRNGYEKRKLPFHRMSQGGAESPALRTTEGRLGAQCA